MSKIITIHSLIIAFLFVTTFQNMKAGDVKREYAVREELPTKGTNRVIEDKQRVIAYIKDLTCRLNKNKNKEETITGGLKRKFSRYSCRLGLLNEYPTVLANFLYALVNCNYADTLIWLVAQGVNVSVCGNDGTILHVATLDNNYEMMALACNLGVDVDAPDQDRDRALHIAAAIGDGEAIEILLAYDANVMLKNNEDKTPAGKLKDCPLRLQPEISMLLMDARCDQEVAQICGVFGLERRRIVREYYQQYVLPRKETV